MRELLLVGASGFARETAEAVRALNAREPTWSLIGILDDDEARHGSSVGGLPILGPIDDVHDRPDAAVVLCTGRPDNYVSRERIVARLDLPDDRYATIVHPTANVGASCRVGAGSVLLGHVDLTADVVVGRHVEVMPHVVLTHDVEVEDFATIASGVLVAGGCRIGCGAYVGSGARLREELVIGERALIGMGALVTRDVPAERTWFGAPAQDQGPAPLPQRV